MSEMVDQVSAAMDKCGQERGCRVPAVILRHLAVAAITAMREPTEAMGAAGLMVASHDPLSGNEKMSAEIAEKINWTDMLRANPSRWQMPVWRAMVDEALR